MTPLEILERQFRPIQIPERITRASRFDPASGVYLLVAAEIVYIGSSTDILYRLHHHHREAQHESRHGQSASFSYALWYPLPTKVLFHYEGALIRALRPIRNLTAPRHDGYDNEILDGFGLPVHEDEFANSRNFLDFHNARRDARRNGVCFACGQEFRCDDEDQEAA